MVLLCNYLGQDTPEKRTKLLLEMHNRLTRDK